MLIRKPNWKTCVKIVYTSVMVTKHQVSTQVLSGILCRAGYQHFGIFPDLHSPFPMARILFSRLWKLHKICCRLAKWTPLLLVVLISRADWKMCCYGTKKIKSIHLKIQVFPSIKITKVGLLEKVPVPLYLKKKAMPKVIGFIPS